ncbi:hypothetical protein CFHF_23695 [Caulobacter flavus]|uniref:Peptidase M23 n=1 Tax=Caulobacter flavus TaxID=1679497 RepID=A0A2N5CLZ3_9CAUL|nr:hypothetical protein [Caulobacter flavus]AYV48157.1 hypothetical protein C1707_18855 [Caulobacter flavus]PLR06918.1 hypothetical protein CFHF_23695 [Caulobacter flavus]
MARRSSSIAAMAASALLPLLASPAFAQSLEDRLRTQLVAVTAELRGAQSRQAALTAQKDAAEKERDELRRRLSGTEGQLRAARRKAAAPVVDTGKIDALTQSVAEARAEAETARAQAAQLTAERDQAVTERDKLKTEVVQRDEALRLARAKNDQAIAVAKDVLETLSNVGVADVLARKEPLTGLHRVRIQKLEQDFGDRIYDSRLDVRPPAEARPPQ